MADSGAHNSCRTPPAWSNPKESGGFNPLCSAIQSAISAFSKGNSKIVRMLAHFLRPKGTGKAQVRLSAAHLCSILSV
jgi:hypothetical protein